LTIRKVLLSWEDVYAILETPYAKSYTEVVDNEVLYHLVDFENLWMNGYMFMEKKRDSAAAVNGSAVVGAWMMGLGRSSFLPIVCGFCTMVLVLRLAFD
jgi:hypothetical protein